MSGLLLVSPTVSDISAIEAYRAEFSPDRMRVTLNENRVPGMDYLEEYDSVAAWLRFTDEMRGKISWYMTVRQRDKRLVGFICLRHRLEYDDDDPEFRSHIGYSVRPSERGKGLGAEQLRLCLQKAKEIGLKTVRIVCRDINIPSAKTILASGGRYVDTIHGEESGMNIQRYDVPIL